MKFKKVAVLFLILAFPLMAQQNQDKSYKLPVPDADSPVILEVDIRHGKVAVQGSDTKEVSIVARSRSLNEEELASIKKHKQNKWNHNNQQPDKPARSREGLTPVNNVALNMKIEQRGNRIEIESQESTFYVELIINVPFSTNVKGSTYRGGGISVEGLNGYLELESWHGDITADSISGPIVAETSQSSIIVNFSQFSEASPSSLTTHSGDIDITVDNNMSANINVQNYQGEVLSGLQVPFEATEQIKRSGSDKRQEIVIGGQLTARLNSGGQDLTLITYNGDVYVRTP